MQKRSGFTLVELSIVLVIIGLVIGGIIVGKSLIHASELRSMTAQIQRYTAATRTFQEKYNGLPGDLPNAQSYWGVQNATPATCRTSASTSALTCNGDGNGTVDLSSGSNENFRYWQHLANAGYIEGQYNGVVTGTGWIGASTTNVPSTRMAGGLIFLYNLAPQSGDTSYFDGTYNTVYEVGSFVANYDPYNPFMLTEDVYNVDVKMDDGMPGTGKVVTRAIWGFSYCTSGSASSSLTATYKVNSTSPGCTLIFRDVI